MRDRLVPRAFLHVASTVVGALEMGLADLAAQRSGQPLWQLLGGKAVGTVRLYANINRALHSRTPEEHGMVARMAAEAGFSAVKCAPFDHLPPPSSDVKVGLECLQAVRKAVGPDVDVMVDVHHRLTYAAVLEALPVFEELGLAWLEDAVHIEDLEKLEDLAGRTSIPLAGGEQYWEIDDVARAAAHGLRVVMPDVKHAGGLWRAKRMCEAVKPVSVSFHNPSGPIGTIASGHLSVACPGAQILEYAFGEVPWRPDCTVPPEGIVAGALTLPDGPGLGARVIAGPDGWAVNVRR